MRISSLAGLIIAGMAMTACGGRVPPPPFPPAPIVEVYGEGPPGAFWINGHYEWYDNQYRWHRGYWGRRPYEGARWHEGRYEHRRGGYVYVGGHW
jgi:hypothetical protein